MFVRVCVTYFSIGYQLLYRYVLLYCYDLYHRDHRELGEGSCFVRVCVTYFSIGYRLLYRYTLPYCNDLYHRDHRELGECSCLSASALCASQSATGCFTATHCRTVMIFTTETTENSEKVHNFVRVCVTSFLIGYRLLYRYVLLYCNDLYHRDHRELGESSYFVRVCVTYFSIGYRLFHRHDLSL